MQLDLTIDTPLVFKHARGSTNGCYHKGELWFLIHGTCATKSTGDLDASGATGATGATAVEESKIAANNY
jgi:hypothetical protein